MYMPNTILAAVQKLAFSVAFICVAGSVFCSVVIAQSQPRDSGGAINVPRLPQPSEQGSDTKQQGSDTKQQGSETKGSDTKGSGTKGSATKGSGTKGSMSAIDGNGRFEKLIQERIANVRLIDKLYSTIPIGFAREQKKYMAKIDALKQRNVAILSEMKDAAIESFTAAPGENEKVVNYLLQMTQRHLTGKDPAQFMFNPDRAQEIFELVKSKPVDVTGLDMYGFRANVLTENFKDATKYLEAAKNSGVAVEEKIFDELRETQKNWERELQFREADATANLPRVAIETDKGKIVLELFEDQAPNTVANFISLVQQGFYNGQSFHKVTSTATAAGGCPYNNGTGGPGYKIKCECYENEDSRRQHFRGVISMIHGGRDTGGSRFFITKQRIPIYDGKFTAFGRVIEGMEVVYALNLVDNTAVLQKNAMPATKMNQVSIIRKRDHEYTPEKLQADTAGSGTSGLFTAPPLGIDK